VSRFVESADKDQDADHIREFLAAEGGEVMISPDPAPASHRPSLGLPAA
jgi:hypothetical protein